MSRVLLRVVLAQHCSVQISMCVVSEVVLKSSQYRFVNNEDVHWDWTGLSE
jgi:hypothetical protein